MNREDIIRMAREADLVTWGFDSLEWEPVASMEAIERFAALIASRVAAAAKAEEREACAKLCGELHLEGEDDTGLVADIIRARGESK